MTILSEISETFALMFRRPKHWQYAALCHRWNEATRSSEVLLMSSRDTGRWVIPKGWPMGDLPGHAVAAQEALEEAGVVGDVSDQPMGKFEYRKALASGLVVPCEVRVFPLEVTGMVETFKEKGQRKLEWMEPSVAAELVHEPGLARLIRTMCVEAKRAG